MEKAEVEDKSSVNSQKINGGETPLNQTSSDQILESLRIISEESMQLSEVVWQEEKLIEELNVLIKAVLKQLNISIYIPPDVFPQAPRTQRIILNDEAHLIFINDQNEVQSKALQDYPREIIFNLALFVVPELSKSLSSYRKRVSERVRLFDRINQELRNLRNIFENHSKMIGEDKRNPIDNGVKRALLVKQSPNEE